MKANSYKRLLRILEHFSENEKNIVIIEFEKLIEEIQDHSFLEGYSYAIHLLNDHKIEKNTKKRIP